MPIDDAIAKFLVQLEADGRSPHTIAQYRRHLRLFAAWWADVGACREVSAIGHEQVAEFFVSPVARLRADGGPRKATSLNILKASLRGWFGYLHRAGYLHEDPARVIRRAWCGRPQPRALARAEQERFLSVLDAAKTFEERRDAVLFKLMFRTGVRLGAALALDVDDVDLDAGVIRLRCDKGDREEQAAVPGDLTKILREYLRRHAGRALFTNTTGRRLSHRHAQRRFEQLVAKAGISRVSPHSLRHTFATELYCRTHDILLVKTALRHRSVASTLVYARTDLSRVRDAIA